MMGLVRALVGLSRRERWLLALTGFLALPAALWLAVAEPLLQGRDAAGAAVREAEDLRAWLLARRAELAALPVVQAEPGPPPVGLSGIEARLQDAGLTAEDLGTAVQLGDAGNDGISLRFERVEFVALMDWLSGIEAEAGYRIALMALGRSDNPAEVAADLRLEPAP